MECQALDPYAKIYTKKFVKSQAGDKLGKYRKSDVIKVAKENHMIPILLKIVQPGRLGGYSQTHVDSEALQKKKKFDVLHHSYNGCTSDFCIAWDDGSLNFQGEGKFKKLFTISFETKYLEIQDETERKAIFRKFSISVLSFGYHYERTKDKWLPKGTSNKMATLVECALEIELKAFIKITSSANAKAFEIFQSLEELPEKLYGRTDENGAIMKLSESSLKSYSFKLITKEIARQKFLTWEAKEFESKPYSPMSFQDGLRLAVISNTVRNLSRRWGIALKEVKTKN